MAKNGTFRPVRTNFWTDEKVLDEFSPEDKYFYMYYNTNGHTTQLGIYRFIPKVAGFEMGYSKEAIMVLLERFEHKYGLIKYSKETNEIAIKDFLRDACIGGGKPTMDCLTNELNKVQDESLIYYIYNNNINNNITNNTVLKFLEYVSNEYIKIINESSNESYNESSTNRENDNIGPTNEKSDADDFFNACWEVYPRKKGKGQVKDATKKRLAKEVGLEQMLRCIERYKAYVNGKDEEFVMYGSTFFNSGYVDYLDENYDSAPIPTKQKEGSGVWQ